MYWIKVSETYITRFENKMTSHACALWPTTLVKIVRMSHTSTYHSHGNVRRRRARFHTTNRFQTNLTDDEVRFNMNVWIAVVIYGTISEWYLVDITIRSPRTWFTSFIQEKHTCVGSKYPNYRLFSFENSCTAYMRYGTCSVISLSKYIFKHFSDIEKQE